MWVATPYGIAFVTCPNGDPAMVHTSETRAVLIVAKPGRLLGLPRLFCVKVTHLPLGLMREVSPTISKQAAASLIEEMRNEEVEFNERARKVLSLMGMLQLPHADVAVCIRRNGYSGPAAQTLEAIIRRGYDTRDDL